MRTTIATHEIVRKIWEEDSGHPLLWLLYPPSLLYRLAIALRNTCYDWGVKPSVHLARPVISVGNVTVGGTGKTPLVIYLARFLKAQGFRPAVLSRGYGGRSGSPLKVVSDGRRVLLDWDEAGDEPVLMARRAAGAPVIAGPDRRLTGEYAISHFGCDVLILDDGFQHRRLHRDLDIVLIDEEKPFGNGMLLPAGPLREPPASLRRAGVVIRTGVHDLADEKTGLPKDQRSREGAGIGLPTLQGIPVLHAYRQSRELLQGATGKIIDLRELRAKRVCGFSGIGKPGNFRKTLAALGAEVVSFLPFPDHHQYDLGDLDEIERTASANKADFIVTTEKDGVRLGGFPSFMERVLRLRIEMTMASSAPGIEEIVLRYVKRT